MLSITSHSWYWYMLLDEWRWCVNDLTWSLHDSGMTADCSSDCRLMSNILASPQLSH